MSILKGIFNGENGMTGIVSEEQEKKFQEQRKKIVRNLFLYKIQLY